MHGKWGKLAIFVSLLVGARVWYIQFDKERREENARDAIFALESACLYGNKPIYLERKVQARIALRRAPSDKALELDSIMQNTMLFWGCEPSPAQQFASYSAALPKARIPRKPRPEFWVEFDGGLNPNVYTDEELVKLDVDPIVMRGQYRDWLRHKGKKIER